MSHGYRTCILLVASFAIGCCRVPPADDGMIASLVEGKVGEGVEWSQGGACSEEVQSFVRCLLDQELTADSAIQIALLNNPMVQGVFEDVGIAHADLIEAGLMSNPSFSLEVRYPDRGGLKTNIEYLITASLLDLIMIPLRVRLAETEFEQTKLRVSNEILDLAFEVRRCFYELAAEKQKLESFHSLVKLAMINRDLITAQHAVGNVYDLQVLESSTELLEREISLKHSQAEVIRLTERLNRLLGLPEAHCLKIVPFVPDMIAPECYALCDLQRIAFEERLDLHVGRLEVEALCNKLGLSEWWSYTNLQVGLAGEREPGGANLLGPGFAGEIPLFNYGQAARQRLYAQLRQALDRLQELQINVSSEVREAYFVMEQLRGVLEEYNSQLLPLKIRIVQESEGLYNVMGLGIDKLLQSKRDEIMARIAYVEGIKRYLISNVDLDKALGGNLSLMYSRRAEAERYCE